MFFKNNDFIIESEPIRTIVDDDALIKVAEHINNGAEDGLSESEIQTLLDWNIENTRQNIEIYIGTDIKNIDMMGLCGFAQTSSLQPFEGIFKTTYNSTVDFNTSKIEFVTRELRHAFGTIEFPLKTKNGVEKKQYLVDTTYRQFFKTIMCENPEYSIKGTYVMDPGYFLCSRIWKTEESIKMATQLLKKGYVELTDENLKLYIDSFMYSSIYRTNQDLIHYKKRLDIDYYRSRLRKLKPSEQEFDVGRLMQYNCKIGIPYVEYNVKTR
jgi:hypothetical protein